MAAGRSDRYGRRAVQDDLKPEPNRQDWRPMHLIGKDREEISMSYRRYLSSVIFVVALMLSVCTNAQSQSEITLLAPRPMQPTIDKIVAKFQSATGHKVTVTYQAAKLIRQLVAKGQPLDVSLIAAPFPGAIASGTIVPGSATPVAGFLTAVAVPKGAPRPDISTPAAVKKALLAAKSIGYEDPEFAIDGEATDGGDQCARHCRPDRREDQGLRRGGESLRARLRLFRSVGRRRAAARDLDAGLRAQLQLFYSAARRKRWLGVLHTEAALARNGRPGPCCSSAT